MTKEEFKQEIIKIVESRNGLKGAELVAAASLLYGQYDGDMAKDIYELVAEKRIMEIEYVLPAMDYRLKSFFIPAGTRVSRVKGRKDA